MRTSAPLSLPIRNTRFTRSGRLYLRRTPERRTRTRALRDGTAQLAPALLASFYLRVCSHRSTPFHSLTTRHRHSRRRPRSTCVYAPTARPRSTHSPPGTATRAARPRSTCVYAPTARPRSTHTRAASRAHVPSPHLRRHFFSTYLCTSAPVQCAFRPSRPMFPNLSALCLVFCRNGVILSSGI